MYRLWGLSLVAVLVGCAQVPELDLGYRKLSDLVNFPDFYPGLGQLWVKPDTLPYGPYQGYDKNGHLIDTIYMIPIADFDAHKVLPTLEGASTLPVDHVEIYFNGGHPGVMVPHYHVVLWHITVQQQAALQ